MPTYIALLHFTQKGVETIKEGPSRLDRAKQAFKAAGGELKAWYLVTGRYDAVAWRLSKRQMMKSSPGWRSATLPWGTFVQRPSAPSRRMNIGRSSPRCHESDGGDRPLAVHPLALPWRTRTSELSLPLVYRRGRHSSSQIGGVIGMTTSGAAHYSAKRSGPIGCNW
jgi:hypothetical protein